MGCIQAKGTTYSPQGPLEKLKFENGYIKGENAGRPTSSKQHSGRDFNKSLRGGGGTKNVADTGGGGRGRGGGGGRRISRESERGKHGGGGNVSQRISVKKIAADELVDGWPKWLVENVQSDALAGLVPKSADSYDKLAKVSNSTNSLNT